MLITTELPIFPVIQCARFWYFLHHKVWMWMKIQIKIPARSHTFVEIDHEIISTVILLPSAESFMKGCCQLQAKVCAQLLVNCFACSSLPRKKVWLGELTVPQ